MNDNPKKSVDELTAELDQCRQEKTALEGNLKTQSDAHEKTIANLQNKMDFKETERLAMTYAETARMYERKSSLYGRFVFSIASLMLWLGCVFFFLYTRDGFNWLAKLNLLPVYGVLTFGLYFATRQYFFYRNLFVDMRHRQTLAQSYHNILGSIEDKEILPKLAEKTVEFLTSPPHVKENDMGTPIDVVKKLIDKATK